MMLRLMTDDLSVLKLTHLKENMPELISFKLLSPLRKACICGSIVC